jgi:hypothetical protein
MNARECFLFYVRNGGSPICSPQIGAGKEWITETTLQDTIDAVDRFAMLPLFNAGLCDLGACNPDLAWELVSHEADDEKRTWDHRLVTPHGTLTRTMVEEKRKGCFLPKYPVTCADELSALEWYIDGALEADLTPVTDSVRRVVDQVAGRGVVDIQWSAQPYELFCFPNTVDTVLLAFDCPDVFRRIMDKLVALNARLMPAVAAGGADFIFLGGPGSEMISPAYYDEFIVPYSQQVSGLAHDAGLLVYSHICSPIEPFLSMGYYNRMGIDLFETLSPPPVGNVPSLAFAFERLDPEICTRGNVGLDVLLTGSVEDVRERTLRILEDAVSAGRKHIVAASDYLFYDISEENVTAMADTVREYVG